MITLTRENIKRLSQYLQWSIKSVSWFWKCLMLAPILDIDATETNLRPLFLSVQKLCLDRLNFWHKKKLHYEHFRFFLSTVYQNSNCNFNQNFTFLVPLFLSITFQGQITTSLLWVSLISAPTLILVQTYQGNFPWPGTTLLVKHRIWSLTFYLYKQQNRKVFPRRKRINFLPKFREAIWSTLPHLFFL